MDYSKLKKQELIDVLEARDVRINYLEEELKAKPKAAPKAEVGDALIAELQKIRKRDGSLDKLLQKHGK